MVVRVTRGGRFAAGVLVNFHNKHGGPAYAIATGPDGVLQLDPPPGEYEVWIDIPPPWTWGASPRRGFQATSTALAAARFTVPSYDRVLLEADLRLDGTSLTVELSEESGGALPADAEVVLFSHVRDEWMVQARARLDASGSVHARDLPAGRWTVLAVAAPYRIAGIDLDLAPGESRVVPLRLPAR